MIRMMICLTIVLYSCGDVFAQSRNSSSGNSSSRSSGSGTSASSSTSRGSSGVGAFGGNDASMAEQGINTAAGGGVEAVNRSFGEGLVGASDSSGRFVGSEQAGQQTLTNQTPNFQQRNSSSRISSLNSKLKQVDVRGTIRLGFEPPVRGPQAFASASLPLQVNRLQSSSIISPTVSVEVNDGTVVVTGTVADPQKQKLLEAYLMLEPGVRRVENRTVVADSN